MKHLLLIAVLAVPLAAPPAWARPESCGDKNTQADMNLCHAGQYRQADKALNAAYSGLMRKLKTDSHAMSLVKDAQRAWLAYRDKECALEAYPITGGSAQPMIASMCLTAITRDRTKMLEGQLHCQEGDLSCLQPQE